MPIPTQVSVSKNDSPKPVDFPNWTHVKDKEITVVRVEVNIFGGRALPAVWNKVWKFINHDLGTGNTGVKGELMFDRTAAVPQECFKVYDDVLWPQKALLTLICEYPGEPQEPLEVQLV
jgi:hypothetical protein